MSDQIQHFLLVFDHSQGSLIEDVVEFGTDSDRALAAYAQKERDFRDNLEVEIVLIGSDSLETVRQTHANYFDGSAAISKYLADFLKELAVRWPGVAEVRRRGRPGASSASWSHRRLDS